MVVGDVPVGIVQQALGEPSGLGPGLQRLVHPLLHVAAVRGEEPSLPLLPAVGPLELAPQIEGPEPYPVSPCGRRGQDRCDLRLQRRRGPLVRVQRQDPPAARCRDGRVALGGDGGAGPFQHPGARPPRPLDGTVSRAAVGHDHLVSPGELPHGLRDQRSFVESRDHDGQRNRHGGLDRRVGCSGPFRPHPLPP